MRTPRVLLAILILSVIYLAGMFPMQSWVADAVANDLSLSSLEEFDRRLAAFKAAYSPVEKICDALGYYGLNNRCYRRFEAKIPKGFEYMFFDFQGMYFEKTPKFDLLTSAFDFSNALDTVGVEMPAHGMAVYLPRMKQAVIVADPKTMELCQALFEH